MINLKKAEASSELTQPAQQTTSPGTKIVPESQVHEQSVPCPWGQKACRHNGRPFGILEDQRDEGAQYFENFCPKTFIRLLSFRQGKIIKLPSPLVHRSSHGSKKIRRLELEVDGARENEGVASAVDCVKQFLL